MSRKKQGRKPGNNHPTNLWIPDLPGHQQKRTPKNIDHLKQQIEEFRKEFNIPPSGNSPESRG